MAIVANYFLWPFWEFLNTNENIENAIAANRNYLQQIVVLYNNKTNANTNYRLARNQAFIEIGNLMALLMPPGATHFHTSPNPPVPSGSTSRYPGMGSVSGSRSQLMGPPIRVRRPAPARAGCAGAVSVGPRGGPNRRKGERREDLRRSPGAVLALPAWRPQPGHVLLPRHRCPGHRIISAVVGSIVASTRRTLSAGKPPSRACSRTSSSLVAT